MPRFAGTAARTPAKRCFPFQKMDRNRDGVVTIEEFLETCQKVSGSLLCVLHHPPGPTDLSSSSSPHHWPLCWIQSPSYQSYFLSVHLMDVPGAFSSRETASSGPPNSNHTISEPFGLQLHPVPTLSHIPEMIISSCVTRAGILQRRDLLHKRRSGGAVLGRREIRQSSTKGRLI